MTTGCYRSRSSMQATTAFFAIKEAPTNATLLAHLKPWLEPYSSKGLKMHGSCSPAKTSSDEIQGICSQTTFHLPCIKHFVKGCEFFVLTDYRPFPLLADKYIHSRTKSAFRLYRQIHKCVLRGEPSCW